MGLCDGSKVGRNDGVLVVGFGEGGIDGLYVIFSVDLGFAMKIETNPEQEVSQKQPSKIVKRLQLGMESIGFA